MPLPHFRKKYHPFSANIFMSVSIRSMSSYINSVESECLISCQQFEMRGIFCELPAKVNEAKS